VHCPKSVILETNRLAFRRLARTLVGLSVLLGLAIVVEAAVGLHYHGLGPGFAISIVTNLPFIVGIAYGGRWLARSDLGPDRHRRIAVWCLGGGAVFIAMNLLLMVVMPPVNLFATVVWIRWATSIGAGTGLLLGVFEARAIDRGVTAERARLRANQAESRRELLDYLNALLRHEVLNSANVIDGRTSMLLHRETYDPADRENLETIQRRARDLTSIIEDARVLLQATTGETDDEILDVVTVLEHELTTLTDYDPSVTVETDFPDAAPVVADALLSRVFSNLLANAVEHHDGPSPTVEVSVEVTAETVRVVIADDGPGVPPGQRATLFECAERDRDHGLGLSLVSTLLERYDGTIELTETGSTGSVFTVELPIADTSVESPRTVGAGGCEESLETEPAPKATPD
jgi:two-component system OmpR family sensor kinase